MLIQEFIDTVSRRLRDVDKRQWTQEYLVEATSAAFNALTSTVPQAYTVSRDITLVEGSTQKLDDDLHRILHLVSNVCPVSNQEMRSVTIADMSAMDRQFPHWRRDKSRTYIWHYLLNTMDESEFYVWPPADASGMLVRGVFTATPSIGSVASNGVFLVTDNLPFDSSHVQPLLEFTLYYCHIRDDEQTANSGRAMQHWQNFFQLLNKRENSDLLIKMGEQESEA